MRANAFKILSASPSVAILRGFEGAIKSLCVGTLKVVLEGASALPFVAVPLVSMEDSLLDSCLSTAFLVSVTGFGGGVDGRGNLDSEGFGEGSWFEGPKILAKDMGLLVRSGFCGRA
jgi:hypothetical protein